MNSADAVVINTIIWNNSGTSIYEAQSNTLEVRYSDVEGEDDWPGEGNINLDPGFLDETCHIDDSSPCYDEGIGSVEINGTWYDAPEYDFEGNPRPFGVGYDIGADEYDGDGYEEFKVQSSKFKVQSYPNPTQGIVNLQFTVYNLQSVSLKIYNALGREVAVVLDQTLPAGEHSVRWDAEAMPAGIYYYRLSTANCQLSTASGKLVKY